MGLDITAYKDIQKVTGAYVLDGEPVDGAGNELDYNSHVTICINEPFKDRADDLIDGTVCTFSEAFEFRAGSYSGYSIWREKLAELANWPKVKGPFWELICFSDCEGVIGPKTSAKLAKDFADYQKKADDHKDDYFRERYNDWRKAFEMASQNGMVDFS